MEGNSKGRHGHLSLFSPSGLLKMSIQLTQQDGLYYSSTDTFTVDTNPRSRYSPFVGSVFTNVLHDMHYIGDDDSSTCSDESDDDVPLTELDVPLTSPAYVPTPPLHPPCVLASPSHPPLPPTVPRSRVSVRRTNLARQLESELWAARLGHCGTDQVIALAQRADGLPNGFEFHPFRRAVNVLPDGLLQKLTISAFVSTWTSDFFGPPRSTIDARISTVTMSSNPTMDTAHIS
jgi:hypothetical protein